MRLARWRLIKNRRSSFHALPARSLPGTTRYNLSMSLKKRLEEDLKSAMRAREGLRKSTLRLALAAVRNAEIDQRGELSDAETIRILQKEVKSRRETIAEAEQAGRTDLAETTEAEIVILEGYLPQPLSEAEVEELAHKAIEEVGAGSPAEMGQVMKVLMPRIRGRAEGAQVSRIVRELLQS